MAENHLGRKMNVLFVMPKMGRSEDPLEPSDRTSYIMNWGLMYVASYLKGKGHNVQCLNLNHYPESKLIDCLEKTAFDVIGTGGLFVHFALLKTLIEKIHRHSPKTKIILGGGIASTEPEFILDNLKADFLVIGEGEQTADLLLHAIENGTSYHDVTGIAFKENNKLIATDPTPLVENLDDLPIPEYAGFEYGVYLDKFNHVNIREQDTLGQDCRTGYVISTRDCALKCTFCFRIMGQFSKQSYRLRSLEHVGDEMRLLIRDYGVNHIVFMDDMVAVEKKRMHELCKLMSSLNVPWSCQLRVPTVDEELLLEMKESGCYLISYGFESASKKILKSMRKGIKTDQILRAITYTHKAKIEIQGNFIFGDPAETIETVRETIKFSRNFKSTVLGFGFVMPLPGSPIYLDAVKKGLIPDKEAFYNSYPYGAQKVNLTSLSPRKHRWMKYIVTAEAASRMRAALGKVLKIEKTGAGAHMYKTDLKCPSCNEVNQFDITVNADLVNFKKIEYIVCGNCYKRVSYSLLHSAYHSTYGSVISNSIQYWGKYSFNKLLASSYLFFVLCVEINRPRRAIKAFLDKDPDRSLLGTPLWVEDFNLKFKSKLIDTWR